MSALRVVFDTNTFHGAAFDILESSPFYALCRSRKIQPIYSHIFLEESMRAYAIENKRAELVNRWLPFICSTANYLCEDFQSIWRRELVQGRGVKASPFMIPRHYENFKRTSANLALDGSWDAFQKTHTTRELDAEKRKAQNNAFRDVRAEVAAHSKAHPGALKSAQKKFDPTHLDPFEVTAFGRMVVASELKCSSPEAVANRWERQKSSYPFFTQFAYNMVYAHYFAVFNHNEKIDLNAQADLDLLTHLLHSHIVVSNEMGFLKTAFLDLWKPRGKVLMTSQQFVEFVAKM